MKPRVNSEIRRRIQVSVAAYAYEVMGESTMSDAEFDAQCQLIDPLEPTGNAQLDEFFRTEFAPDTGMWIGKHPDLRGVRATYIQHYEPHIPGARERRLAAETARGKKSTATQ